VLLRGVIITHIKHSQVTFLHEGTWNNICAFQWSEIRDTVSNPWH